MSEQSWRSQTSEKIGESDLKSTQDIDHEFENVFDAYSEAAKHAILGRASEKEDWEFFVDEAIAKKMYADYIEELEHVVEKVNSTSFGESCSRQHRRAAAIKCDAAVTTSDETGSETSSDASSNLFSDDLEERGEVYPQPMAIMQMSEALGRVRTKLKSVKALCTLTGEVPRCPEA